MNPNYNPIGNPYSRATSRLNGPFGAATAQLSGQGNIQIGPYGVAASMPLAPGFSINPTNVVNGAGGTSPFGTNANLIRDLGPNAFGQTNPYTPLFGTPIDVPDNLRALGNFGGLQNSLSPYAGLPGLPTNIGRSYGGPGGATVPFAAGGSGFGGYNSPMSPMQPQGYLPAGYQPVGISPRPQMAPGYGGGYPVPMGPQNYFSNPSIFGTIPQGVIPGMGQSVLNANPYGASRYSNFTDGIAKLYLHGQDTLTPRDQWGAGSRYFTPNGIFEVGIGPNGGNANAGQWGTQAAGDAWAMTRAAWHPGMVVSYSNPYYNNYNFNTGFIT